MSTPATFLAGAFVANPASGSIPELLTLPDWTHLQVVADGVPLSLEHGSLIEHRRILDLRQGLLWREWRQRDPVGRITHLRSVRLASLHDRHLLLQTAVLTAENYAGRLQIDARLEASPQSALIWTVVPPNKDSEPALLELTTDRGLTIVLAFRTEISTTSNVPISRTLQHLHHGLVESWAYDVLLGESLCLTRVVSVHASRETGQAADMARRHLKEPGREEPRQIITAHVKSWGGRWETADVELIGDQEAQRALRLASYHLVSAANAHDERCSVGARALTGDSYKGHVFWDTEIYVLPFYTFTDPATARALLMYRYHTLPGARRKARTLGYRGALFAWESTDTGEETTPASAITPEGEVVRILTGEQEHHISADIAYAVWQYWLATHDQTFLLSAGAEILIETARFWASRTELQADGRYHIRRVIGPDEFHETVDDNAYTNVMAQWNLRRGAEVVRLLSVQWPQELAVLADRLSVRAEEPDSWLRVADLMETGFDPPTSLFEQFRGYFGLEEVKLPKQRRLAIDAWIGRERLQRSKVIKQADVVAISALLWDQFPPLVHEVNFCYYEPRTAHASSLSPALHAMVAARLGDIFRAEEYFRQAADIDLANNMGNAAGGVHIAAMGGLWQAAVLGIAGLRLREKGVALAPHLPRIWQRLSFCILWRTCRLRVMIRQEPAEVILHAEGETPMEVELIQGPRGVMAPGMRVRSICENGQWQDWQNVHE